MNNFNFGQVLNIVLIFIVSYLYLINYFFYNITKNILNLYNGDWNNDLQNGYGKIEVGDYILKSTWRNGKMIEYPNYENGKEEDLKNVDCNFVPQEMSLITKDLPHLEKTDIKSSLYKLGSVPSFFNE